MTLGDSELGTSKLGEPVSPTTLPAPVETPRDRADDVMKSAYFYEEGSTWDKFLTTITDQYEREYATIREMEAQRAVDTATDEPLEKVASLFHLSRWQGESDAHFRRRIKLQLPKHTTSATIDEVLENSAMLLDCDKSQIALYETFDVESARFDVFLEENLLRDANVTVDEYVTLLRDVKAAGVRVVATIGKQFTYRSKYEADNGINDPERGYASEDGSIDGAPYADLITARYSEDAV